MGGILGFINPGMEYDIKAKKPMTSALKKTM
jgi:hypothetical protein